MVLPGLCRASRLCRCTSTPMAVAPWLHRCVPLPSPPQTLSSLASCGSRSPAGLLALCPCVCTGSGPPSDIWLTSSRVLRFESASDCWCTVQVLWLRPKRCGCSRSQLRSGASFWSPLWKPNRLWDPYCGEQGPWQVLSAFRDLCSTSSPAASCFPTTFPFEPQTTFLLAPSIPPLWGHLQAPCAPRVLSHIPSAPH